MRRLAFLVLAAVCASNAASAQTYPSQPIHFVNGLAAGGATDVAFRTIAEELRVILGQSVVNENKPGANGLIAAEQVLQSKPDGYTFFVVSSTVASGLLMMKEKATAKLDKDFVIVAPVTGGPPGVIAAIKGLPASNFPELVAYAKAHPGTVRYASSGAQTGPHLEMYLLAKRAGIELVHLPQKGAGGVLTALNNSDAQIGMVTMATIAGQVKSGDLKVLATVHTSRLKNLPDVATLPELGYPEFGTRPLWHALFAPAATPQPILDTMFTAIQKALETERMKELYDRTEMWPVKLKTHADAKEWAKTSLAAWQSLIAEVGAEAK